MPTYTVQQSCVCILKFLTSKLKYRTQPCCIAYAACVPSNDQCWVGNCQLKIWPVENYIRY